MTTNRWRLALALSAAALGLVAVAAPASAERDRSYRVRGGVRASGAVRVRPYSVGARPVRPRVHVHRHYPRYYWGGGLYFGYRYYAAPPPCSYECGPGYYYGRPYAQPAVAAVAPAPALPTFGLGLFAGGTTLEGSAGGDAVSGEDVGLLGRFRVTPHLQLEGELSKSELFDGQRVDRSMGGALLYDFAPWSQVSLNVLGGLGAGSTEVAGDVSARHVYGELGVGVDWRLTDRLSLFGDLRAGQRDIEHDDPTIQARLVAPEDEPQAYTRGRIGLLLFF